MKNWRSFFSKKKFTRIFIPDEEGAFVEYTGHIKDSTNINTIANHFKYTTNMYTIVGTKPTKSHFIEHVIVKKFTKNVIFLLVKQSVKSVNHNMVNDFLNQNSSDHILDAYKIENSLLGGIQDRTLTSNFLGQVLDISDIEPNGISHSKKLGVLLYFHQKILVSFEWDNPLRTAARYARQYDRALFTSIAKNAEHYWDDEYDGMYQEINWQFEAKYKEASNKEITEEIYSLHMEKYNAINFYMLLVCHYNKSITQKKFEILNHGRFHQIAGSSYTHYRLNNFSYVFDSSGNLLEVYSYIQGIKALHFRNS